MTEHKCSKIMWGGFGDNTCKKSAMYEYEGLWYCKQHHPPTLKEKDDRRRNKWKAENDARISAIREAARADAERKRKAEAYDRLVEWLNTEDAPEMCRVEFVKAVLEGR